MREGCTMNSQKNWEEISLKEITTKIGSGVTPRGGSSVYINSGTSLIRSQNIYNGYFDTAGLVFINDETAKKMSNVEIFENDVLINITGDSVARCTIVPNKILPARINQHVSILRCNKNKIEPRFLKYTLISPYYQSVLLSIATGAGATRNALTKSILEDFKINLPPLETQKKIASILSGYDDLIENNLKRIKILEEMAQQTYEEWFVRMRFPRYETAVINAETGLPEGWEKVKLGDIISFKVDNRGKNPTYYTNEGIPVLDNHLITNSPFVDLTKASRFLDEALFENFIRRYLEKDDVLITLVGTVANITLAPKERCAIVQNTIGLRCNEKCNQTYLYQFLKNNKQTILNNNRGSAQPSVKVGDLLAIDLLLPPSKLLNEYDKYSSLIFIKIQNLGYQNQRLREARDILLPRLMMGMVDV